MKNIVVAGGELSPLKNGWKFNQKSSTQRPVAQDEFSEATGLHSASNEKILEDFDLYSDPCDCFGRISLWWRSQLQGHPCYDLITDIAGKVLAIIPQEAIRRQVLRHLGVREGLLDAAQIKIKGPMVWGVVTLQNHQWHTVIVDMSDRTVSRPSSISTQGSETARPFSGDVALRLRDAESVAESNDSDAHIGFWRRAVIWAVPKEQALKALKRNCTASDMGQCSHSADPWGVDRSLSILESRVDGSRTGYMLAEYRIHGADGKTVSVRAESYDEARASLRFDEFFEGVDDLDTPVQQLPFSEADALREACGSDCDEAIRMRLHATLPDRRAARIAELKRLTLKTFLASDRAEFSEQDDLALVQTILLVWRHGSGGHRGAGGERQNRFRPEGWETCGRGAAWMADAWLLINQIGALFLCGPYDGTSPTYDGNQGYPARHGTYHIRALRALRDGPLKQNVISFLRYYFLHCCPEEALEGADLAALLQEILDSAVNDGGKVEV